MIAVIASNKAIAEEQMRNYGYLRSEWLYVRDAYDVCVGVDQCFVLEGATHRPGTPLRCSYKTIIATARSRRLVIHYKPRLYLGKIKTRTEDCRNDLYCGW